MLRVFRRRVPGGVSSAEAAEAHFDPLYNSRFFLSAGQIHEANRPTSARVLTSPLPPKNGGGTCPRTANLRTTQEPAQNDDKSETMGSTAEGPAALSSMHADITNPTPPPGSRGRAMTWAILESLVASSPSVYS